MVLRLALWAALWATPPAPQDLEFARVQEDWVAGFSSVYQTEASLPRLFDLLDSDRYRERASARFLIGLAGHHAIRPVAKATHHHSETTRSHARALLRRMFRCVTCGGTGLCPVCWPKPTSRCPCRASRCRGCDGSGDYRYTTGDRYWDGDQWVVDRVDNTHLFGRRQ